MRMTWRGVLLLLLLCAAIGYGVLRWSEANCVVRHEDRSRQACMATLNEVCPDWRVLQGGMAHPKHLKYGPLGG